MVNYMTYLNFETIICSVILDETFFFRLGFFNELYGTCSNFKKCLPVDIVYKDANYFKFPPKTRVTSPNSVHISDAIHFSK